MKRFFAAVGLAACAGAVSVYGQGTDTPAQHIATAKSAAGSDLTGLFDRTCGSLTPAPAARGAGPGAAAQATLARDDWHAEPVKVFDNLYFLGQTEYSV